MSDDGMPRDARGLRPCAWCGGPIRQPATGRLREYCGRSCRQRAYEARREAERIAVAVATATAPESSRDETGGAAPSPAPTAVALPAQAGGQSGGSLRSVGSAVAARGSRGAQQADSRTCAGRPVAPPEVRGQGAGVGRPEGPPATPPPPPTKGKITGEPLPLWE